MPGVEKRGLARDWHIFDGRLGNPGKDVALNGRKGDWHIFDGRLGNPGKDVAL